LLNVLFDALRFASFSATLQSLVTGLQRRLSSEVSYIVVKRSDVVRSLLEAVKIPDFSFNNNVSVLFTGEEAEDQGGPRREFLRYIVLAIARCYKM